MATSIAMGIGLYDAVMQGTSLVGAALLLGAFVGVTRRRLDPQGMPYHVLNFVGAALLVVSAVLSANMGFVILDTVWAMVSAASIVGLLRAVRHRKSPVVSVSEKGETHVDDRANPQAE